MVRRLWSSTNAVLVEACFLLLSFRRLPRILFSWTLVCLWRRVFCPFPVVSFPGCFSWALSVVYQRCACGGAFSASFCVRRSGFSYYECFADLIWATSLLARTCRVARFLTTQLPLALFCCLSFERVVVLAAPNALLLALSRCRYSRRSTVGSPIAVSRAMQHDVQLLSSTTS